MIADADGVYSPADLNYRLLLGLKGTMSEAEVHLTLPQVASSVAAHKRQLAAALLHDVGDRNDRLERLIDVCGVPDTVSGGDGPLHPGSFNSWRYPGT